MADINGRPPRDSGSCVVELKREHAGDWYDHQIQKGGGPLDLIAHATGLAGRELIEHAASLVNLTPDSKPRADDNESAETQRRR
jgi:putative DNA primase/helicase